MSDKPIVAVVGATGAQGGSVVKFLLADGGFRVRGITRNLDSEKAKGMLQQSERTLSKIDILISLALIAKGVEVVKADLDDVPSLTKAFTGAHGVFGVTNCTFNSSEACSPLFIISMP